MLVSTRQPVVCRHLAFACAVLFVFCLVPGARAASVSLAWDLPTENVDGSPLIDLAGCRIHYGLASRTYSTVLNVGKVSTYTVSGLTEGQTYYLTATAFRSNGMESAYADELVWTAPDLTPPTITPPAPVTTNADASGKGYVPNFVATVSVSDNVSPRSAITVVQAPTAGTAVGVGTTTVKITATDAAGNSSECNVQFTVVAGNRAPVVNAGPDLAITLPVDTASLQGVVTDDGLPAPGTLSITWSKVSGPGTVIFSNASAVTTSATFSKDGVYVLRLTAGDGALTTSDDVTVTVRPIPVPAPPRNLRILP